MINEEKMNRLMGTNLLMKVGQKAILENLKTNRDENTKVNEENTQVNDENKPV